MRAHLDGDVLVYRAGFAAEHTLWSVEYDGLTKEFQTRKDLDAFLEEEGLSKLDCVIRSRVEVEPEGNALFSARHMVRSITEAVEADDVIVYLSGPTNYRTGIATIKPYKGNRDPDKKPVHGPAIKAMIRREFAVQTSEDQEADDDMAIAHYSMWLRDPHSSVLVTIDKDLDMIPGLHYNFVQERMYYIEPIEGMRKFYEQVLKGDTVDNIPGCKGIGPKKAEAALAECATEQEMYDTVLALYVQHYKDNPEEALLENARLLWIRREENQWWHPPTK